MKINFLKRPAEGDPARAAADGVARVLDHTEGDILVFLPGVAWIRRCVRALEPLAARRQLAVVELHGSLSPELQDRALEPTDRTKVVVATNIAETSLTIDGVRAVVDCGLARVLRYDRGAGINRLETVRISRASAAQRAGRSGRQGPGVCLRLWTEAEDVGLRDAETPEVARLELSGAVLQLLAWGETDASAFPWFEAPPQRALDEALELLALLGAVNQSGLTSRGRVMANFPLQPRLSRLLVEGWKRGVLALAAWAGAAMSEGLRLEHGTADLFETGLENERQRKTADGRLRRVYDVRDELVALAERHLGPARERTASRREAFGRAVLAAFPDRVVRRRSAGQGRALMVSGREVRLDDRGQLAGHNLLVAVEILAGDRGTDARISHAVPIEQEWLPTGHLSTTADTELDPDSGRVRAWERLRWCDLVLAEHRCDPPDGDEVARVLAGAAAAAPERALGLDREPTAGLIARLRCLAEWRPDLDLPTFTTEGVEALLPSLCQGKSSLRDLQQLPMADILRGLLTPEQRAALEREAPERIRLPSGSNIRLTYEPGRAPVLAVRIQELFGLGQTPTVAGGRVKVMLHLLAPNMRPQQITDDLASFWANTYPAVRSELRGRYPKHDWPKDPMAARATSRTKRR